MALTEYERYQLEWMIGHRHSLKEFVRQLDRVDRDGLDGLEEAYRFWEHDYGFDGECFVCEEEWRDAEGAELREYDAVKSNGNRNDSVRDWYMEAYPDDELGASINPQMTFDRALDAVALGGGFYDALGVGDSFVRERIFHELSERTGLAYDDIYGAWMDEKPIEASSPHGITKDMVREGIEQGVIRFEANPDPNDPWKTMCCIGEDGGLFYFVDTTGIPPEEYIRMNQNNLDMVVDDVWEALNGDILRDFADDYERYASILREPHEGGTGSLTVPTPIRAVGAGYSFNLFPCDVLTGISLKETGTVVTVDGRDYQLLKGATFEDSRMVDTLLDSRGEKRIADYRKQPQGMSLKQAIKEAREASQELSGDDTRPGLAPEVDR